MGKFIVLPKLAINIQASKQVGKVLRWYNNIIVLWVPPAAPTKTDDSD